MSIVGVGGISNGLDAVEFLLAGADAIGTAEQTVATLQQQIDALRDLSASLAFDGVVTAVGAR